MLFILMLFLVSGCASLQKDETLSAKETYKQGLKEFRNKHYVEAEKLFEKVMNEFPNSKFRPLALIALGSSHYKKEEYEEAIFHFERFIEQYPASPKIVRAYYYKAMCSFNQMESHERDQTNTHLALEGFEKIIHTFSDKKYVKLAGQKKEICRKRLAKNLLYIGRYYFGIGAYHPAINRMKELLENYPEQDFLDEAIFLLGESYLKEDSKEKAFVAFNSLMGKYPNSKYKTDVRDRLDSLNQ